MSTPTPFFYLTADQTKTPVDVMTVPSGTSVTLAGISSAHPDATIVTVLPKPWPPVRPVQFVYRTGDQTKQPVVLADQPVGTDLTFVSNGKEQAVVAGTFRMKPPFDQAAFIALLKQQQYEGSPKPANPSSF